MSETKRQTELDVLRLLATLAVIMIHGGLDPHTDSSAVQRIYWGIHASIVWCVPVFFMISGRFFLDPTRNIGIQKVLTKYIPHIAIPFLMWSFVYTIYYVLTGSYDNLNIFGILAEFIHGPYHLWFLYMLAGLYLLTPLLRKIAADEKALVYFLFLFAAVNVTVEYLIYLPKIGGILAECIERIGLQAVSRYTGYYLLGYYLYHIKDHMSQKTEAAVYLLGIMMFVVTIVAECFGSAEWRETDFVKQYMKPNVILYSAALYTFFLKRVSRLSFSEKARRLFAILTDCGFGVYCIHALLNECLPMRFLPKLPFVTSILRVMSLYIISLAMTYLIRKIPYIGKKIT